MTKQKKRKARDDYSYPIKIDENTWFYVEDDRLSFWREVFINDSYVKTEVVYISHTKLLNALISHGIIKVREVLKRKKRS